MPELALLRGARVAPQGGGIERADVLLDGPKIARIAPELPDLDGALVIDLAGLILAPGFIDVHVHGGGGFSLLSDDQEEFRAYARWAPSRGVTSFLATVCAADVESAIRYARAAELAAGSDGGAELLGVNFEGPFVSPDRRGALPATWPQAPDPALLDRLLSSADVALMTIAPELDGALDLIRSQPDWANPRLAIGHTDATYEIARQAFTAGVSHITHAFNAMRPLHHREPGPIAAAIEHPHVTIEVIADGVHLHPATVGLLVRAAGVGRICLVTDAVAPAGLESGDFRIAGEVARLEDGSVRLPDGTIAGSAATMDAVVRNVVEWGAASPGAALAMASAVPARVAGVEAHKGALAEGYDADLVALTDDLRVVRTWAAGRLAFTAE